MKILLYLLEKEFKQIYRNKAILPLIFIMPIIQLLILSYAIDYEIKNLKLFVVDYDQSGYSNLLIQKFTASHYFNMVGASFDQNKAKEAIRYDEADLCLIIPQNFEKDLMRTGGNDLQLLINAIDGTKAGLASNYAGKIILDFNGYILRYYGIKSNLKINPDFQTIQIENSNWYNPTLDYQNFMVPGILVLLVTMIGSFLASMNIVREKEIGTIEQINVTPIKKSQFILGKTIPFWIIGMFEMVIGLGIAKLVFSIPIVGSLLVLFSFTAVFLPVILGLGLFISTITDTQQQAMFISWFFLVIFILMSGLFTAIENMPVWAQKITLFNPIRYFIEVIRLVLLKGAGFADIQKHFAVMIVMGIFINTLAVIRYRKTV